MDKNMNADNDRKNKDRNTDDHRVDRRDHRMSEPRSGGPAETAMRQGIIALSPFFVVVSRLMGVLISGVGLLLVVAGIAGADDGGLVLAVVGLVLVALGLLIFFGGPRYARTVRRHHGAGS